ncbi:hypothetical protein [Phytohalomonas tamaricis]|nr:hypothetical protein [Phytohalomonas tamaricis]
MFKGMIIKKIAISIAATVAVTAGAYTYVSQYSGSWTFTQYANAGEMCS